MEILNDTPFEVEAMPLKGPGGKMVLTIVVKGTFDIRPGEPPEVSSEQIPVAYDDEFYDKIAMGSVKFESDITPFKPRADIALIGKAYGPGQRAVRAAYCRSVSPNPNHSRPWTLSMNVPLLASMRKGADVATKIKLDVGFLPRNQKKP